MDFLKQIPAFVVVGFIASRKPGQGITKIARYLLVQLILVETVFQYRQYRLILKSCRHKSGSRTLPKFLTGFPKKQNV
jgi:hypothetical protein